jgi:hypothetical protein
MAEVADLAIGIAAMDQRAGVGGVERQHAVEVGDCAIVGALARRQQDAAAVVGERQLGIGLDRVVVLGERGIVLADAFEGCSRAVKLQRVGLGRIDRAVIVAQRLEIVACGEQRSAQRRARRPAIEPRLGDLGRCQGARLQRVRAGADRLLGELPALEDGGGRVLAEAVLQRGCTGADVCFRLGRGRCCEQGRAEGNDDERSMEHGAANRIVGLPTMTSVKPAYRAAARRAWSASRGCCARWHRPSRRT